MNAKLLVKSAHMYQGLLDPSSFATLSLRPSLQMTLWTR